MSSDWAADLAEVIKGNGRSDTGLMLVTVYEVTPRLILQVDGEQIKKNIYSVSSSGYQRGDELLVWLHNGGFYILGRTAKIV